MITSLGRIRNLHNVVLGIENQGKSSVEVVVETTINEEVETMEDNVKVDKETSIRDKISESNISSVHNKEMINNTKEVNFNITLKEIFRDVKMEEVFNNVGTSEEVIVEVEVEETVEVMAVETVAVMAVETVAGTVEETVEDMVEDTHTMEENEEDTPEDSMVVIVEDIVRWTVVDIAKWIVEDTARWIVEAIVRWIVVAWNVEVIEIDTMIEMIGKEKENVKENQLDRDQDLDQDPGTRNRPERELKLGCWM